MNGGKCVDHAVDYIRLGEYLTLRYTNRWRRLTSVAKSLIPVPLLARRKVKPRSVDVLFLHPNKPAASRHAALVAELAARGASVTEETVPSAMELIIQRKLLSPATGWQPVPHKWRLQQAYAEWLIGSFRPKVLVSFMDDSLHTPFLHAAVKRTGGVMVNIAHTICFPNIDFSMCDVDWMFLFGQRSLDNLIAAPVRYGSCKAAIAGSPFLSNQIRSPPDGRLCGKPPKILWLGQYLHQSHRGTLRADMLSLARFCDAHPEVPVAVRVHPLDRGEMQRFLASRIPKLCWLKSDTLLPNVIHEFDIVASSFSAGLIEAAACGKPVIGFLTSGLTEALGLQDFGLPLVANEHQFAEAIAAIESNYAAASTAALRLAEAHYFGLDDATGRLTDLLSMLLDEKDPSMQGVQVSIIGEKHPCRGN